jgi:hypothetical protein
MPYAPNPCPHIGTCSGQYYDYNNITGIALPNSTEVCWCQPATGARMYFFACNKGYPWNGSYCVRQIQVGSGIKPVSAVLMLDVLKKHRKKEKHIRALM